MKNLFCALLALTFVGGLAGCGGGQDEGGDAAAANNEIVGKNPSNIPPVSEADASGDASAITGPAKGGN